MEVLRTERLRLERLSQKHAAAYLAYQVRNRSFLEPWEPARPEDYYTAESVSHEIARSELDESMRRFVIFEGDGSTMLGMITLGAIAYGVQQHAQLGYSIDERHCGRGFATEAGRAVIAHAFDALGLHRIFTSYQPENKASGRVLRKLGFEVIGYSREHLFINGAWRDGVLVALINERWALPNNLP